MCPLSLLLLTLSVLGWNLSSATPLHTPSLAKRVSNGRFTYYGVGLGACGKVNQDSEFVVALNIEQWADGSHCFDQLEISYKGKRTTATVVDQCPGCPYGALDLSPSLFSYLTNGDLGLGVISGSWDFGGSGSDPPPPTTTKPHTSTRSFTTSTRPVTTSTTTSSSMVQASPSTSAATEDSSEADKTQGELLFELYDQLAVMIISAAKL